MSRVPWPWMPRAQLPTRERLLDEASGSDVHERAVFHPGRSWRPVLLYGVGIYGGSSFVWQVPMLLDGAIAGSLRVSDRDMRVSSSAIFVVWAVGSVVLGQAADRLGRKPVAEASALAVLLHLLGCAVATSFGWFACSRLLGAFALGGLPAGFALIIENEDEASRSVVALVMNMLQVVSVASQVLVHALCHWCAWPWRVELLGFVLVRAPFVAAAIRLVPESAAFTASVRSRVHGSRVHSSGLHGSRVDCYRAHSSCFHGSRDTSAVGLTKQSANQSADQSADPSAKRSAIESIALLIGPSHRLITLRIVFCFVAVTLISFILSFQARVVPKG